jgi:hypothetical protein
MPIDVRLSAERRSRGRCHGRIRIASVGVLLPIFFVLSVIHAEAALANASTGICLLQLRMERRMKPAVTVQMLP